MIQLATGILVGPFLPVVCWRLASPDGTLTDLWEAMTEEPALWGVAALACVGICTALAYAMTPIMVPGR